VTNAEFGEQDRGVPVGHADRFGVAVQAEELPLEPATGGRVVRMCEISDVGEIACIDGVSTSQFIFGVDHKEPRQVQHRALLDAGERLGEGDPGQLHIPRSQQLDAAAGGLRGVELQRNIGMPAAKFCDGLGHEVAHGDTTSGDLHHAGDAGP